MRVRGDVAAIIGAIVASVGILVTVLIAISETHHTQRANVVTHMNAEFDKVNTSLRTAHQIVLNHTDRLARIEGALFTRPVLPGGPDAGETDHLP